MNSRGRKLVQMALARDSIPADNMDDISEDDDDSIKDKNFTLTDHETDESESFESSDSEGSLLVPLHQGVEKVVKDVLNDVINKICLELEKDYTKKGTLRRRKKYDESPLTRKNQRRDNKIRKFSTIKENCNDKCKKKCIKQITIERQQEINRQYWSMNPDHQKSFITHRTTTIHVKRRSVVISADSGSGRNKTVQYSLTDSKGEVKAVCKKFFLATLGYDLKSDRILRNITLRADVKCLLPKKDNRGRHKKENKFDEEKIVEHIESFRPSISHYRREHAPQRKYLPSDISKSKMHKHFMEKYNCEISYELL